LQVRFGRPCYTRSHRVNGRVVREYVGTGELAELAARADELARAARRKQAEVRRIEHERWESSRESLRELESITDLFVQAAMLAAGYHRHDRGAWRKRRPYEQDTGTRGRTN